jgi:hypothetical protein
MMAMGEVFKRGFLVFWGCCCMVFVLWYRVELASGTLRSLDGVGESTLRDGAAACSLAEVKLEVGAGYLTKNRDRYD